MALSCLRVRAIRSGVKSSPSLGVVFCLVSGPVNLLLLAPGVSTGRNPIACLFGQLVEDLPAGESEVSVINRQANTTRLLRRYRPSSALPIHVI